MSAPPAVDLATRLSLRPKEAAAALGICETTLRQIAPEIPRVWIGSSVRYPVRELQEWLSRHASTERRDDRLDQIADDVVASLEIGPKK